MNTSCPPPPGVAQPPYSLNQPSTSSTQATSSSWRNFRDAIRAGVPLLAPADEAIRSLELGNAMLLSGLLGRAVDLPIDAALMERELQRLAATKRGALV